MVEIWNSMITKLTIAFIALVLVISGMTFIYTYNETKSALLKQMQDELVDMSQVFSSRVDGDAMASLQPGDEGTSNFTIALDTIYDMRNSSSFLAYSYILRVEGGSIYFLVDDAYGEADAAAIGDLYETSDAQLIIAAMDEPTTSSKVYTDIWGSFLSGYAPIFDSEGNAVAVMAIDMDATTVMKNQDFIGNTIYLIMGVSIIFAGVIVALFALTMSRDIKKLNLAAEKISKGDMSAEVEVRRKDEIGDLAESFSRMLASLKFEMMMRQEDEAEKKGKN
jgi:methyl-accepting chemotaxis protein